MDVHKVAILGGGNVALATSAEFTQAGFMVNIFELPAFKRTIQPIIEKGGIEYSGVAGEGFVKPNLVTTDIEKALKGVGLIILTAPVFAHESFVDACLPFFSDGQIFLIETAYFACLRFAKKIRQIGKRVVLAEMNQSPYTCTKKDPAHIYIDAKRNETFIAAFPGKINVMERLGSLKSIWPDLTSARNVLQTSLDNMNWIAHPPITLIHRGLIERSEEYYLPLRDALPPSVIRLMEALERDRIALGAAFGIDLPPIKHTFEMGGATLEEALRLSTEFKTFGYDYKNSSCPYLTEDLYYALPPIVSIANQVGVPVPAMSAVLHLFSIIDAVDYLRKGLNVEKMGIDGMDLDEIRKIVENGF
jgi:opine dehydrogenase